MKHEFPGQHDGEKLLFVFRRHVFAMRKGMLLLVLLTLAGFVPFAIVPTNVNLLWIALLGFLLGLGIFFYHWIGWYFTIYVVTSERIRQDRQKGLFNTSVVEITLDKIHNISVEKAGLLGNIFNYGTIVIQTYVGNLVIAMVPDAMMICEKLKEGVRHCNNELIREKDERKS